MSKKKAIGFWGGVAIGVGGMVGAGIFSLLGVAGRLAGNATFLAFIIAGLVALASVYSFAKLAVKYPSAGGTVEFLVRGWGPGVVSGGINILLWITYVVGLALFARAFGGYARSFLAAGASPAWTNVFATAIVLIFLGINLVGARAVGKAEVLIVGLKVAVLVGLAGVGLFFAKPALLSPSSWPSAPNVLYGAAVVFLAYAGFGLIATAADDMENPRRTVPRALYAAIFLVMLIYVSVSVMAFGNLPVANIVKAQDYTLAEAARPFLGTWGFKVVAATALFSTASAINAQLYGATNISYVTAKEGELPALFERRTWRNNREGLYITAALTLLCANLLDLERIAALASGGFLIVYGAVNAGHLKLYRETGARPGLIWLALAGCLAAFAVLVYYVLRHSPVTLAVLAGVVALSFVAERLYRRHRPRPSGASGPTA
ncbi:MAG: APC family permease [Candidatus Zixiibacteriota bacterium]|jgi:amino acid transporter